MTDLVLLHGWAAGPEVWACQEKYFSEERIVKVNYHKGVKDARIDHCLSLYATAAMELIDRATDRKAVLLGWSLGALVALELALYFPEKIKSLVLAGGTGCFTQAPGYSAGLPRVVVERMQKRLSKNVDQTLDGFYSLMFTAEERQTGFEERFRQGVLSQGLNWSKEELAAGLNYLLVRDLRCCLKDIDLPVLIVHGERDVICSAAGGLYLHENLSNSQFTIKKIGAHSMGFSLKEGEVFKLTGLYNTRYGYENQVYASYEVLYGMARK